jgi:3D (Asp-Asp-Asp) domain-containing protein
VIPRIWPLLLAAIPACAPAERMPTEMLVRATAYSWREPAHKRWGTKNAIGGSLARPLEGLGHCAVDPEVIPLGSILHVPGIGSRIATDTGRLIRGRDLDIHFDSLREMREWGARRVTVRVLRWGWRGKRRN